MSAEPFLVEPGWVESVDIRQPAGPSYRILPVDPVPRLRYTRVCSGRAMGRDMTLRRVVLYGATAGALAYGINRTSGPAS